ncbi:MAG: MBL fold metallo-hydrolase [Proteobacteria bacterium]|nr:MBL fold metallo-hydrolase [Pseudomonadota bacterium]
MLVPALSMILAAAAPATPAPASPAPAHVEAPAPPSDGFHYQTLRVAEGVHLIYRLDALRVPAEGNVTVIEQADGLVVVDAGGSPVGGRRIIEQIRRFSSKPVKVVIVTHWHGDHNLGVPAFRAAWPGVRVVAAANTGRDLGTVAAKFYKDYGDAFRPTGPYAQKKADDVNLTLGERRTRAQLAADAPLIAQAYDEVKGAPSVDQTFAERLDLPDAKAPVEVLYLGNANTEGDAVVWLPRQKVLVTGDIVVSPHPFGTDSYPEHWVQVLKQLRAYDFKVLIPGHGPIEHDRAYLDALIALIEDIRGQVTPLAKAGLSLEQVRAKVNFDAEYPRFVSDPFYRRFFDRFFTRPMVENAFKEARGETISQ